MADQRATFVTRWGTAVLSILSWVHPANVVALWKKCNDGCKAVHEASVHAYHGNQEGGPTCYCVYMVQQERDQKDRAVGGIRYTMLSAGFYAEYITPVNEGLVLYYGG